MFSKLQHEEMIIEAAKKIIGSNSEISINAEDFGDFNNIIDYSLIRLENEETTIMYSLDQIIAFKTSKIIVNTTSKTSLKLDFLSHLISEIREQFSMDIELIYGSIVNSSINEIIIEVFLLGNEVLQN